jgi:transcriptional regulator with XRE-family HTH domain
VTPIQDRSQTTSALTERVSPVEVNLAMGLLVDADFGTSAGVLMPWRFRPVGFAVTSVPAIARPPEEDPASEVRELRSRILANGLSKQEIARAIGVDRRSLSGYAKGDIRPSRDRLKLLRTLADLTEAISLEHPGRVRDVLLTRRGRLALIDQLVGTGRSILQTWRTWVARSEAAVTVTQRHQNAEPVWAAAARALAAGRLQVPPRGYTVRPDSTYQMDLVEATAFAESDYNSRRRGNK